MAGKSRTIALVTSALGCHSRAFCEGAAEYLRNRCGWSVRLVLRDDIRSAATLRPYDGVIVREIRSREYEILESCGKPVVEAAVKGTGSRRFASVDCDERALSELAARHFLERGFESFAFCGYRGVAFSDVREQYFTEALRGAGKSVLCYPPSEGRFSEKLVEEAETDGTAFSRWVLALPKGTGVFCANDVMAHRLLSVCIANRIRVPRELSILGADDDFLLCNVNNPSLSSISLNANGIGAGAARLLARILGGDVKGDIGRLHEEVPPGRLTVRNSTEIYRMGPDWLSDALVYIDRNAANVSASDVYRAVRRSHTAVDAAFSDVLGTTVQKRIMSVRMTSAKRLLEDGKVAVAEIAAQLGFPSVQYFSSTFKLHFNATPAAWRKAHAVVRAGLAALLLPMALCGLAATNRVVSTVAELGDAVGGADWGDRITLKDGVYDLSSLPVPEKDPTFLHCKAKVTIASASGDPAKCVLLGPGAAKPGRCLALDGGDSRLSGVTVSNFCVRGSSAAVQPGKWSDSTWYTNCVFAACRATGPGGAIFREPAPGGRVTCDDCTFADCVSDANGGALASSAAIVANGCRFVRCRALNGDGGAGSRITANGCRFTDCSAQGRGGAGGGAAVSYGATRDCVFEKCVEHGYAILRNSKATHCAFVDCVGASGFQHRFEDCVFRRCGGVLDSTLVNCRLDACSYPASGAHALVSNCTLTNCTLTGTTGGDPRRWNSGMLENSTLVNCLVAGNASARDLVENPSGTRNCRLVNTLLTKESEAEAEGKAEGRGWDPAAIRRRIAARRAAREAKLAAEGKSGIHELLRIDFDNEKPRAKGCYGGFWCGNWGDSSCEFSLVPGAGGKGQAMRCNLRGMVGGELQVFSQPWVMWQNSWYRLRFKARGADHPGRVSVGVRKYGYPWSMLGWPFKEFHPGNEWKEYVVYKRSQHDVSGGFGIMLALGDVGCVDFDDFIVEKLDYDPTETEAPENPNPPVRGNLIPRGSFETAGDPFFILERFSTGVWPTWNEAWMERAEGGHDGRYCLRFPPPKCVKETAPAGDRLISARTLRSVRIPVASGHRYRLSGWYRLTGAPGEKFATAYCSFGFSSGKNGWGGSTRFCITDRNRRPGGGNAGPVAGEWQRLEVVSAKPAPRNVRSVTISIEINGHDIRLDGLDFRMADDDLKPSEDPAEKPYELQAAFDEGDPRTTPRIVTWGRKLPIRVAAMPKGRDRGLGDQVGVTLRVVAYPDRVTATEKLTLKAGEERRVEVDPKANGILRVELEAEDAGLAAPLEVVMARLPEPRKTGPESFFGTHLRMCPYFVNYAAAIGIKWQRLHDCSNMCKMKWANPAPGVYQWADEIVDYIRAKGLSILALPDYPSQYVMPTNAQGQVVYDNEGYRAWCRELAGHYRGRIDHFELWNEPYMPYFYRRDAKEFGKTFNAGAEGIREGNPSAKVIGWCTEFTTPKYVTPFLRDYPVEKKPDFNSVHYYYNSVPGDGDLSYERIIGNIRSTFGEYAGGEIWNTEGNLALSHTFYSKMRPFDRANADRGVAFGSRGWAEPIASGIAKTFLYTAHNTDTPDVGGLMTLIDYDRSPTPEAAATATTAYFIDGLKPVRGIPAIDGCKFQVFAGQGRTALLLWDDVIKVGRAGLDASRFAAVYDAMGNRLTGKVELTMVPVFVTTDGEDAAGLVDGIRAALE